MGKKIWCDSTLLTTPIYYCLATSEKILKRLYKELNSPYFNSGFFDEDKNSGKIKIFEDENGFKKIIVFINPKMRASKNGLREVIVHESVHVWQEIAEYIGEKSPSSEFEAYSIGAISLNLMNQYDKQVKVRS